MGINWKPKQIAVLLFSLGCLLLPLSVWAAHLIQNHNLETFNPPYGTWSGGGVTFNLVVAENWEKFFVASGTEDSGNKLRYFKSSDTEFLFGSVEKRDEADAQIWWSTRPYDAGIYQQVSSVSWRVIPLR